MLKLVKRYPGLVLGLLCFVTLYRAQFVLADGNVEAGKQLYQTRCAPCHGPDGKAETPMAKALTP